MCFQRKFKKTSMHLAFVSIILEFIHGIIVHMYVTHICDGVRSRREKRARTSSWPEQITKRAARNEAAGAAFAGREATKPQLGYRGHIVRARTESGGTRRSESTARLAPSRQLEHSQPLRVLRVRSLPPRYHLLFFSRSAFCLLRRACASFFTSPSSTPFACSSSTNVQSLQTV